MEHTQYIERLVPTWFTALKSEKTTSTGFCSPQELEKLIQFLQKHSLTQYKLLSDVTAVDWLGQQENKISINNLETIFSDIRTHRFVNFKSRFLVVYNLVSVVTGHRLILKTFVTQNSSTYSPLPSLYPYFNSSSWPEREVWDMFGITFTNHPDLRRILTDYGFQGFPLRKDFPLSGFSEVRYDDTVRRVVSDSLELPQEFRNFDIAGPWASV
jgi:NADH dehydrogenase (ubiquinone) Fe-S protein 3